MDADQPGLFDLPAREPQATAQRRQRGRNQEVWVLAATAEVTITGASVLLQAAARLNEDFVITIPGADHGVEDSEPEAADAVPTDDPFDALAWLIWPTEGLQGAIDVGALRILSVEREASADSADHGRATWRVPASSLTSMSCAGWYPSPPDEAAEISDSLAVAWQRAADPFAPLRAINGISWKPGRVTVEHLPARA